MVELDCSKMENIFSALNALGYPPSVRSSCPTLTVERMRYRVPLEVGAFSDKGYYYITNNYAKDPAYHNLPTKWSVQTADLSRLHGRPAIYFLLQVEVPYDGGKAKSSCALGLSYPNDNGVTISPCANRTLSVARPPISLIGAWRALQLLEKLPALTQDTPDDCLATFGLAQHNPSALSMRRLCFVAAPNAFEHEGRLLTLDAATRVSPEQQKAYQQTQKPIAKLLPDIKTFERLLVPFMLLEKETGTRVLADDSRPMPGLDTKSKAIIESAYASGQKRLEALGL